MNRIFYPLSILFLFACTKEQNSEVLVRPGSCDSVLFTFDKDIRPIFNSYCNFEECHASNGEGYYNFTQYPVVVNRVRAGTIEYRLDLPFDDPQHMPVELRIDPCDYYKIKTWIKQNYPER